MSNSSAPKFIPTTEELSTLQRDLRFHPSMVENPKTLTREQVAVFNRHGYPKGIRIFSEERSSASAATLMNCWPRLWLLAVTAIRSARRICAMAACTIC